MDRKIKKNYSDCEILAPAGSYQCMVAAFNAGADAVYVGGSMFGARAYANNFDKDELIKAIEYAHIRGKRLYLTVNTLIKQSEIEGELENYLAPLYEAGLDAVIVQDLGVLRRIRNTFKDLPVHASTQMTVTGVEFAKELKELGVTRIVTARELSYKEINDIYEATNLEIESFVHGALCYSYSGQCLLSSLIGGRSGNRGRCAQPCRLNYELYKKGEKINKNTEKCLLSPKDMCTLNILPQILKSGVYSLKIEGRMKKPEYVAGVVSTYRKYIDMIKSGSTYKVDSKDIDNLREIYNRGGFTEGFYGKQNGSDMMSLYKPNHYGVKVAKVLGISKNKIKIQAVKDIDKTDVLELNLVNSSQVPVEVNENIAAGRTAELMFSAKEVKGMESLYDKELYRTRNNKLIENIENAFINCETKVDIEGEAFIKADTPMKLCVSVNILDADNNIQNIKVCAYGSVPDVASNKPADEKTIKKQLIKTGNTPFNFRELKVVLDDGLFIPVSALNELRREAIELLYEKAMGLFRRKIEITGKDDKEKPVNVKTNFTDNSKQICFECVISTREQFDIVLSNEIVSTIAIELSRFEYDELKEMLCLSKNAGKNAYLALPYICRDKAKNEFEKNIDFFKSEEYDGYIIRNYEEFIYFANIENELAISNTSYTKRSFVLDTNVYVFNDETKAYLDGLREKYDVNTTYTLPYELNYREIKEICNSGQRMEIYGYIPVMTSAGCVKKTTNRCDTKTDDSYYLKDRTNAKLNVVTNCRYCYNTIYNPVPLYLGNDMEDLKGAGVTCFSARFTFETKNEVRECLEDIKKAFCNIKKDAVKNNYTRGHFRRGVM